LTGKVRQRQVLTLEDKNVQTRKTILIAASTVVAAIVIGALVFAASPSRHDPAEFKVLRDAHTRVDATAGKDEVRFAVYGDVENTRLALREILREVRKDGKYDFTLCAGDIVSGASDDHYESFCNELLDRNTGTPMLFAVGNEDEAGATTPVRSALYEKYFGATHYSFAAANTLFVTLDNAAHGKIASEEVAWLENLLKSERSKYKALIVFMHKPPYDNRGAGMHHAMGREQGERLLDLLKKYDVTAIFCGHIHSYYEWNRDGVPVYVSGGGGAWAPLGVIPNHHFLEVKVKNGIVAVTMHRIWDFSMICFLLLPVALVLIIALIAIKAYRRGWFRFLRPRLSKSNQK